MYFFRTVGGGGVVAGKMFGSSSFFTDSHPTVEEQVDMARKISHSLTHAHNETSKGQSMYVKRKKKSVKWIHEGEMRLLA
jgi:hypothetical protein